MLISKKRKRIKEVIELLNQKSIRTFGEKETSNIWEYSGTSTYENPIIRKILRKFYENKEISVPFNE